jgi:hypothetical protein
MMTLFHPASGTLRVKCVESCTNIVLHSWLQEELSDILASLPEEQVLLTSAENRHRPFSAGSLLRVFCPSIRLWAEVG